MNFRVAVSHLLNFLIADWSKINVNRSSCKMSDEEDDHFVTFGTPLPEYEDGKVFFTNLIIYRAMLIASVVDPSHDSSD